MNSAYNRQKTRPRKIVVVEVIGMKYFYYCVLCGYRWTWQTDQPKPQVIVRPDLVQLGAQKLEEDRKAAAAAAWQMEQQRRNKER